LRDHHHVPAVTDRVHNDPRVLGQPRPLVVAWQVDGHGLMPGLSQQRDDATPVPRRAAGTRKKNEGAHWLASRKTSL
jgi:hypothetical protein